MKLFRYPIPVIFLLMLSIFSATVSFAQVPVNNECSGATLLTSSGTCINVSGTLDNSNYNPSTMPATGCGATNKRDVWYRFVAQAPTHDINVSNAPSQMRLQLFSGTCGSFTSLACGNGSITATGLSIGTTYYIRVYRQNDNDGDFDICVTHVAPANDNCSGAISLTSNASCVNTAGTLNTATASAIPVGCFAAGVYYDVWFSFIAANTTETITISGLGANITNPRMQLYSGACATTSLQCGTTTITRAGLTIGTTYYVRVANYNSNPSGAGTVANFNICVTHTPPANDECTGAISLTSNASCINTAGTLVGATYTTISSIGCGTASRNDVWYSFVALSTSTNITLSSAPANPRIQLFSGSCGSLTSVACGNSSLAATGLTLGATYFVRIYTNPNVLTGTFNLCITHLPPANDECTGAISLTSGSSCVNTTATLNQATPSANPAGCFAPPGIYYDVWFSFVAVAATETVTLSSLGANIPNPQIQLYSGTCGTLTSLQCAVGTTITRVGLTVGNTYYVRVANFNSNPSGFGTLANFNICVTHAGLSNDLCAGAISIQSTSGCNNVSGTTVLATYTTIPTLGCGANTIDVWYSFVAQTQNPLITGNGSGANGNRLRLQLFSGNCGALTPMLCGTTSDPATLSATGLTIGTTYYVRVYSSNGSSFPFDLCITDPPIAALVEQSKSYVNITKLATGGTVEPGDILEIRATFVVRGGVVDSIAYFDTLENNGGLIFLDSIVTRTNEGKVYKSFTNAQDGDAGWYSTSGADTTIQINIGSGSSGSARGTLTFLDRPRVYSSATIIMATYRVQVYEAYDGKINWGGGGFTYKDRVTGVMRSIPFKNDSLVVYVSPGLCSSTLSATNQVGIETNGTFNVPASSAPFARNRGTSTAVPSYTYDIFRAGANGPQDYYYGVTNNTSATFSIINTLPKVTGTPQRVFNLWDIIGDHTNAVNTAKGNPPCDTTQPVSAANPCGYMLVVNAAYKTDTAFRSNITGLCPNTYYEISAWVRNICYKCGCDSAGRGASTVGHIPFATNDSSGVPPNIAFQLNGQDYYQTGNLYYTGTGTGISQQASDTVNAWVKRGFVYKTGPTETGFELLIRNNAPGGGGNDWAIDDIVVATCSPDVTVTPGPNPFVCDSNTVDVGAIISSYYDNYTYYKWEKSTDNGATWSSTGITGGPITPTWNGSAWAYNVSYPTFIAYAADSGSQYRVVIASTPSNLSSPSCSFSGNARVTLTVDGCSALLDVDILSFKGKNENNTATLYFATSKEKEPIRYEIQKSKDASSFVTIGEITGYRDPSAETNRYTYVDPELLDNTLSWYRIKAIKTQDNKFKYSKVVQLIGDKAGLQIESLINPFNSHVKFDLISGDNGLAQVEIIDQYQHTLKRGSYNLVKGRNRINIDNTDKLPAGFYILRVTSDNNVINKKIIKRG